MNLRTKLYVIAITIGLCIGVATQLMCLISSCYAPTTWDEFYWDQTQEVVK